MLVLRTRYKNEKVPILTIGCSDNDNDGIMWKMLHDTAVGSTLKTKGTDKVPVPYIADRVEVGSVYFIDVLSWTGDFSRCMGWFCLAPNQIK